MEDLNVLPLGFYDMLIGMDWLEKHQSITNCKTKTICYQNELGKKQEMQGIQRPVRIQQIIASKFAKCIKKGCQIHAVHVGYTNTKDKTTALESIPVIQEFENVFPEDIHAKETQTLLSNQYQEQPQYLELLIG